MIICSRLSMRNRLCCLWRGWLAVLMSGSRSARTQCRVLYVADGCLFLGWETMMCCSRLQQVRSCACEWFHVVRIEAIIWITCVCSAEYAVFASTTAIARARRFNEYIRWFVEFFTYFLWWYVCGAAEILRPAVNTNVAGTRRKRALDFVFVGITFIALMSRSVS